MIARKSLVVVIAQFLTRTLGWVGLLVLAKLWGGFAPEALGVIGFAMAFVGVFYIISDLGFSQAHVKKISEGKDIGTCIGTFLSIKIILTTIMAFLVLFTMFFLDSILHLGFTDATKQSVVFAFLLYYIFASIQQIAISTFNGRGEIAKMQITAVFENIVKIPLTILVALAGVGLIGLAPIIAWPELTASPPAVSGWTSDWFLCHCLRLWHGDDGCCRILAPPEIPVEKTEHGSRERLFHLCNADPYFFDSFDDSDQH